MGIPHADRHHCAGERGTGGAGERGTCGTGGIGGTGWRGDDAK